MLGEVRRDSSSGRALPNHRRILYSVARPGRRGTGSGLVQGVTSLSEKFRRIFVRSGRCLTYSVHDGTNLFVSTRKHKIVPLHESAIIKNRVLGGFSARCQVSAGLNGGAVRHLIAPTREVFRGEFPQDPKMLDKGIAMQAREPTACQRMDEQSGRRGITFCERVPPLSRVPEPVWVGPARRRGDLAAEGKCRVLTLMSCFYNSFRWQGN
jgi:hypothetical protein